MAGHFPHSLLLLGRCADMCVHRNREAKIHQIINVLKKLSLQLGRLFFQSPSIILQFMFSFLNALYFAWCANLPISPPPLFRRTRSPCFYACGGVPFPHEMFPYLVQRTGAPPLHTHSGINSITAPLSSSSSSSSPFPLLRFQAKSRATRRKSNKTFLGTEWRNLSPFLLRNQELPLTADVFMASPFRAEMDSLARE